MDLQPSSLGDLARRLVALDAANPNAPGSPGADRVCATLRAGLINFAGADGYFALLRRALALVRHDFPMLEAVKIGEDGRLEGFEAALADAETSREAAIAITTHLLTLLVTFIGASLTLRLVCEAWPDARLEE